MNLCRTRMFWVAMHSAAGVCRTRCQIAAVGPSQGRAKAAASQCSELGRISARWSPLGGISAEGRQSDVPARAPMENGQGDSVAPFPHRASSEAICSTARLFPEDAAYRGRCIRRLDALGVVLSCSRGNAVASVPDAPGGCAVRELVIKKKPLAFPPLRSL